MGNFAKDPNRAPQGTGGRRWVGDYGGGMRLVLILLLVPGVATADVVVLKSGEMVSGRVVRKSQHLEVTTSAGLRTYPFDEIEKLVKNPKELLGDADAQYEQSKKEFGALLNAGLQPGQNVPLKAAMAKALMAREAYGVARSAFPESKYDSLDTKIVRIMQLLRMIRGRMGSGSHGAIINPQGRAAVPVGKAFAAVGRPGKPLTPAGRNEAREILLAIRKGTPASRSLATAAAVYLSRTPSDWGIEGEKAKAFEEYLGKGWLRAPSTLTPELHLEAAEFLASRSGSALNGLSLFAYAHLSGTTAGPERDAVAKQLGLSLLDGVPGTPRGHAVADMNHWISNGDYDLAVLAFIKRHRSADSPDVRFVWSWAALQLAQEKGRGFEKAERAYGSIRARAPAMRDHVGAIVKSIRSVATCSSCGGAGDLRCTNCHGKKEVYFWCRKCDGQGSTPLKDPNNPNGGGVVDPLGRGLFGRGFDGPGKLFCSACNARGYLRKLVCRKCKDGRVDCRRCKEPRPEPDLSDIVELSECTTCETRGTLFEKVAITCPPCHGLGVKLTPQSDPGKVLEE